MPESERRPIEPDDLYRFVTVPDAQIVPDGAMVAYVVNRIDPDADDYRSAIWVVPVEGGEAVQFTAGTRRDSAPRWSPDGGRLAFLSDRDGGAPQLYVMPSGGGEPRRLTNLPDGAGVPVWSPDGGRLAFAATVQREPAPADEKARGRWEQRPRHVDFALYKRDGAGYTYDRRSHLFVVAVDGGEPRQVTDGDYDEYDPAWSPDGTLLAYVSARDPEREFHTLADLLVVPAEGGEERRLARLGRLAAPAFSPDGQSIAVYATIDDGRDWSSHAHLWLVPVDGGAPRDLLPDLDRSCTVQPPPFVTPRPAWTADGSALIYAFSDRGNSQLATVQIEDGARQPVTSGEQSIVAWNFAPASSRIAYVVTDLETPADVALIDINGSGSRRLTRLNAALLDEIAYTPPVRRTFPTPHGEIDGWVTRAADASGPSPLLVSIHGGPHGFYGSLFPLGNFHWLAAVARGWTVVALNPTGSGSYGRTFARDLIGRWGEYDLPEQLAAVDTLIAEGIADGDRLAVEGYSYGGLMTSWTVGHTDRFKATVIGAPVTNLESFHGTADIGMGFGPFEMGGPLLKERETFRRLSPVNAIDQVTTPCLVLHGEADDRCPIGQGEEWFIGLRAQGKTAEMVRYPGGSHLFRATGRPSHRVDYIRRLVDWIERYARAANQPARELVATGD